MPPQAPLPTVSQVLTELVRAAASSADLEDASVVLESAVPSNDARFGDWQSNHGFRLGKASRQNPRELAERLRAHLPTHPAVAEATVAGAGFLNFRLSDEWLGDQVALRAADPRFAAPLPGVGRRLVIDYSSPNIAKRMHVGHLRSTILGAALDRMYRFLGWEVVTDNHLGDWGTPFGMLIVAWHRWRDEEAFAADPVAELQRLYQQFRDRAKSDPTLEPLARAETAKLQAGDPENRGLWERFVAVSLVEFDALYARLGVSFDVTLGESAYDALLPAAVDAVLGAGIAQIDQGAVIVRFGEHVWVVRKSDGAATYAATDLATIRYRMERWRPDRVVYVTDVRQKEHFEHLFEVAGRLGVSAELVHVWFGMLRMPDGTVAASRTAGRSVNLVDVLDEAAARARVVVDERSDEIPEEERILIAEAVGTGAVRYADLSQNPQSDILFDWERMLSLQGNTAPYLMYAHARCRSILRKAGAAAPGRIRVEHPLERELALSLLRLPEVIMAAAEGGRPNLLCDHLYGIAGVLARFYLECPVLRPDVPAPSRESRIGLVAATAHALALGLDLLGLHALERM